MKQDDLDPPPAERRPKPRSRVLLSGLVVYGDGAYSFDCSFRNLSEAGARVVMGKNQHFPSQFFLINIRDRVAYDCRIVWNKGSEVGVAFKATVALSSVTDPALAYLKRLWLAKAAS
ncbi:MAG: PilZ domain-containing protein [Rhizobiales bacterium]|nr:PilZ domain-containing protein [Hyphomicrobiales bacterium]